tara:strand:+ start:224 stop:823 length:600 start_codon:yes stop_codon:yes gene_type:complete
MKRLLLIFILTLSFQTLSKADDIRDFQIEEMGIGDSALDFFSKKKIDNKKTYYPNSKKFFRVTLNHNSDSYEKIQLHIKNNDTRYIIQAISGIIYFRDKLVSEKECLKKHNEINRNLSSSLSNLKISKAKKRVLQQDKTGNSFHFTIYYDFNDEETEYIKLGCVMYGNEYFEKFKYIDHLRLGFNSKNFSYWLQNEAFK